MMTYYNTKLIQESASNKKEEHPPITAPILGVHLSFLGIMDRA